MELKESRHTGDFLLSEANGSRSRETETLAEGQNLSAGTVVAKLTAGGNITALNPAGDDGSQTAYGVLYANVNATAAAQACVVIVRDAELVASMITWPAGIETAQQTAAIAALAEAGIILR